MRDDQKALAGYYMLEEYMKDNHGRMIFHFSLSLDTMGEEAEEDYILQHLSTWIPDGVEEEELSPMSKEEDHSGDLHISEMSVIRIIEQLNDKTTRLGVYLFYKGEIYQLGTQGIALHSYAHKPVMLFDDRPTLF